MKLWHVHARKMYADGLTCAQIGKKFGKSVSTVFWAVSDEQQGKTLERIWKSRAAKKFAADPTLKDKKWVAWLRQP